MADQRHLTGATARTLAAALVARRARTVLLDGPSGSGKSTFALALLVELRRIDRASDAALVRMDDVYPGWSGLDRSVVIAADRIVRPHALGLGARWQAWNWASGTTAGPRVVRAPLLLVEGCGAAGERSRRFADLTVWIEADEAQRKQRALARDGALFEPHWDSWDQQFQRYCKRERPREGADLVLDSSDPASGRQG
ncbi:ATP-binding protein [Rathayibacter sp. VKM Ac-2857]|uniref:ATP-binding protein n=1 Tax=Rathayibacter sp. VKM Ac-2857 TaxID=2739020 RepID=UPI001563D4F2|nr:ATP-binding protein [Rathayibacter sp. VKM Ac-2857]NQX14398.1 ATP-binding protein [Rathayibacter sp. VKM Ac-2857]